MGLSVKKYEICVGILLLSEIYRLLEKESGANNKLCSTFYSKAYGLKVRVCCSLLRLIVLVRDTVLLSVLYKALPSSLVECLVIDGSKVCNKSKLVLSVL